MGTRFEAAMKAAGMEDRYGRDDGITFHRSESAQSRSTDAVRRPRLSAG
jgi:hypothetical protein